MMEALTRIAMHTFYFSRPPPPPPPPPHTHTLFDPFLLINTHGNDRELRKRRLQSHMDTCRPNPASVSDTIHGNNKLKPNETTQ